MILTPGPHLASPTSSSYLQSYEATMNSDLEVTAARALAYKSSCLSLPEQADGSEDLGGLRLGWRLGIQTV